MRRPIHPSAPRLLLAAIAGGCLILPHPLQNALLAQESGQVLAAATIVDARTAWQSHDVARDFVAGPEWEEVRADIHATALRMAREEEAEAALPHPARVFPAHEVTPGDRPLREAPTVEIRREDVLGELRWDGSTPVILVSVLSQ